MPSKTEGFSLVEFLVGSIIAAIAATSIMYGVASIRKTTNLISLKEKAFEELSNYTDFWKSKIAAGEWAGTNSWTPGAEFDLVRNQKKPIKATMYKKGGVLNGNYPYPLYVLETKIVWQDRKEELNVPPREMNLKVYQLEFK